MKLLRFLFALLLLLPLAAQAQNFPKRDREPVVDAAKLLSPEQTAQLTQLSEGIFKDTTRQLVIATIPDLEGNDIADYGYKLGRAWGLGDKDANNGIILIVAPNERKVRIEVGYGLEPIMTDALSSQIINDTIVPRFKAGDIPGGIVAGAQAIGEQMKQPLEVAEQRAKAAADKAAAERPQRQARRSHGGVPIGLIFWCVVLLCVLVPMFLRRGVGGSRRYRGGGDDGGALPILLWTIASELTRHSGGNDDDWGGGGGWGGGSSGGGGGGGFSGGGGSFGGGGASGSW